VTARKQAVIVCGNAAVGKSTHGAKLAASLGAALLDIDTCTERLARVAMSAGGLDPDDRDSPAFKRLLRDPIYETLFDIAKVTLASVPCVIVGPFTQERRDPSWPARLEARLEANVRIVVLHCDAAERRRRIAQRGNPRDAGKLAAWDAYAAVGRDEHPPPFPHEWVDTTFRVS
jgi:predicted kinase